MTILELRRKINDSDIGQFVNQSEAGILFEGFCRYLSGKSDKTLSPEQIYSETSVLYVGLEHEGKKRCKPVPVAQVLDTKHWFDYAEWRG